MIPLQHNPDGTFDAPPDGWVHISPVGAYPVTLRDGERERKSAILIDPASCAAQVAAFRAEASAAGAAWAGLLVDFDHASLDDDRSTEAAGWAEDLQSRDDGLWARVRWSDSGLAAIRGGRFRFTSPVHLPSQCDSIPAGLRPRRLHRLALTNDPRMLQGEARMRPISSRSGADAPDAPKTDPATGGKKGNPQPMDYKAMLLAVLGLPAEATDQDIEAAQAAMLPKPKQEEALASAKTEAEAMKCRAEKAEAALAAVRADATLDKLSADGYAIASRDDARKALVADHDRALATIRAFLPSAKASGGEPLRSRAAASTPALASKAGEREAFVAQVAKDNHLKSRADAVARAQRERPDLWKP
jgi:phage I-like protein